MLGSKVAKFTTAEGGKEVRGVETAEVSPLPLSVKPFAHFQQIDKYQAVPCGVFRCRFQLQDLRS